MRTLDPCFLAIVFACPAAAQTTVIDFDQLNANAVGIFGSSSRTTSCRSACVSTPPETAG